MNRWIKHVTVARVLFVVAAVCAFMVGLWLSDPDFKWGDFGNNLVTEMIGALLTVGFIEWLSRANKATREAESDATLGLVMGVKFIVAAQDVAKALLSAERSLALKATQNKWLEAATAVDDAMGTIGQLMTAQSRVYWIALGKECAKIGAMPLADSDQEADYCKGAFEMSDAAFGLWLAGGVGRRRPDAAVEAGKKALADWRAEKRRAWFREWLEKAPNHQLPPGPSDDASNDRVESKQRPER